MDRCQPLEKEKLENECNELYEISEKQENRVRHLETKLMQLVFAYVFFQGVIFVSIFGNPNVSCDYWWIRFSLSCLIFVIFAIPFKTFVRNWERTKYYHEMNYLVQDSLHQKIIIFSTLETNMDDHPQKQQVESLPQSPLQLQVLQSDTAKPQVQSQVILTTNTEPQVQSASQSPSQLQVSHLQVQSGEILQSNTAKPQEQSQEILNTDTERQVQSASQSEEILKSHNERQVQSASQPPSQSEEVLKSDTLRGNRRKAFIHLVSLALVAYTFLILKACKSIPCHRDATP